MFVVRASERRGKAWERGAMPMGTRGFQSSWWNLCSCFSIPGAFRERSGGENPPGWIDREGVREPEISGSDGSQPARLRNSVSWVIQVFSGHCFGSSCSVFSS